MRTVSYTPFKNPMKVHEQSRLLIQSSTTCKEFVERWKGCRFNFFHLFVSSGNLMFGYISTNHADGLVFLCERHVTLHLFVFSVKATLPFNVLM